MLSDIEDHVRWFYLDLLGKLLAKNNPETFFFVESLIRLSCNQFIWDLASLNWYNIISQEIATLFIYKALIQY